VCLHAYGEKQQLVSEQTGSRRLLVVMFKLCLLGSLFGGVSVPACMAKPVEHAHKAAGPSTGKHTLVVHAAVPQQHRQMYASHIKHSHTQAAVHSVGQTIIVCCFSSSSSSAATT
jgi:hypothetical protein